MTGWWWSEEAQSVNSLAFLITNISKGYIFVTSDNSVKCKCKIT